MTREAMKAGIQVITAVADAIRELGEVPSGHLYARLMGHLSFDQYESIISILKRTGLVTEQYHLLRWVGGVQEAK